MHDTEPSTMHFADQSSATDTQQEVIRLRSEVAELRNELTERSLQLEKLNEALSLRDRALDALPSDFMICSLHKGTDRIIVYVNQALASNHGYTKQELIGQSARILGRRSVKQQRSDGEEGDEAQLLKGRALHLEDEVTRRDGSTFWIGLALLPLSINGEVTHTVSIGSDITAKRAAEIKRQELQQQLNNEMKERERMLLELRLAQKLESVGRLAAGIAHEINTPIQYVGDSMYFLKSSYEDIKRLLEGHQHIAKQLAVSEPDHPLLRNTAAIYKEIDFEFLDSEIPRAFDRTFDGVTRVTNIVRAMKEFSHPDGSAFSSTDLNHALQTTLTVATNEYKYSATVRTQFTELPLVLCNVGEVNQVFLNLIVNAAHAIQDAGKDVSNGEIFIATAPAASGDAVEVTIADNGCGIPQEHLDKIFDPFFTTKEVGRGTGQGLAIARSIIVDKHGGDIRINSVPGKGTEFVLSLPLARPQNKL